MEEVLLVELFTALIKNESPTNIVLAGVGIMLLRTLKRLKRTVEGLRDDVKQITVHLHSHEENGSAKKVIPISEKKP